LACWSCGGAASGDTTEKDGVTRIALIVTEVVVALNAFGGGVYGMSGAQNVPREWLEGSPFDDYFIPALILFVGVGGSMSAAAIAAASGGREWGVVLGLTAAVILLDWIVVQVAITGYTSFLQPLFFAVGLLILALSWRWHGEAT
jgi:hypothetical protein